uniref:Nucleoporin NUP42 n=1 Tax=Phallusia mammillata TaxID=59560 RepID=A0A6F9DNF8_9ASCI|nr:nucleoporin-like protein 2 [Phallusia mammillata]
MVVCKFFQQGKCKFGNRCRNEHIRDGGYQGGERSRSNYGRNTQENYRQDNQYQGDRGYQSGFGRNSQQNSRQDGFRENRQQNNEYGRNQQQGNFGGQGRNQNQDDYSSPFMRNNQQQHQQPKKPNQDRFHWSKGSTNKFSALENAPNDNNFASGQAEDEAMIKSIQDDMKVWVESKMWPYSCYYCSKGKKCIEGLPDIQPEELRVLFLLHGEEVYKSLIQQVDMMYNKRKDELFIMMNDVKQAILSDMNNSVASNPSSCLTIMSMYGQGVDFKQKGATVPPTQPPSLQADPQPLPASLPTPEPQNNPQPSGSVTPAPEPAKPKVVAVANIFKNAPPVSVAPQAEDTRYTNREILTDEELEQFQNERFTLGEIPMRPPPKEMCR